MRQISEQYYEELWNNGKFYFENDGLYTYLCCDELEDAWGGKGYTDQDCIDEMLKNIEVVSEDDLKQAESWEETKKELNQWLNSQI